MTITELEEVFLKVGEDKAIAAEEKKAAQRNNTHSAERLMIEDQGQEVEEGTRRDYHRIKITEVGLYVPSLVLQATGLALKRLSLAIHDFKTIPLIMLPIGATIAAFVCNATGQFGDPGGAINYPQIATAAIIMAGYIPMPGLVAEQVDCCGRGLWVDDVIRGI